MNFLHLFLLIVGGVLVVQHTRAYEKIIGNKSVVF